MPANRAGPKFVRARASTIRCSASALNRHAATRFAARLMLERRLGLADARYVLALIEALPRSPEAVALLLRPYCG